jgi:DNA modification methylase
MQDIPGILARLLAGDLTFQGQKTNYATHNLHAFAAKFPPQLPRLFINHLTRPGEVVLDPMSGSGTTLVETLLNERQGMGIDLDPLAILVARVKTTSVDLAPCQQIATEALCAAQQRAAETSNLEAQLSRVYSGEAIAFFRYWYEEPVIRELFALVQEIQAVREPRIRAVLQVVFSSLIITKSGGVTRARDLAHSRPHRVLEKRVRQSVFALFPERLKTALTMLATVPVANGRAQLLRADARRLPLADNSVHLIVTSPPYAANAIDYMRAHKFSLIWFGQEPKALSSLRRRYIGAELRSATLEVSSPTARTMLRALCQKDPRRAAVVAYYYHDLKASLQEMVRVLKPGRAAVLVVGSSNICGIEIKVPAVTAELAQSVGFRLIGVAHREIARDARLMPISRRANREGIEARMHEEGVIGLVKMPEGAGRGAKRLRVA